MDLIGFDLHFHFSILKPIFLPNLFVYILWDPSLVNISETIAGDRSNQFGLLTEQEFWRKSSRSISIDNRFCNRFINLGRPIFSLNHSGASAATVFTIPTTFGIAHAPCYIRDERPELDHRYLIFLLFRQHIMSPKLYLPSVRSVVLVKTQLQSIQSPRRTWFFFSASARTSNPPLSLLVGCDSNGRQRNQPCDCTMTLAFHVHQKICGIKIA